MSDSNEIAKKPFQETTQSFDKLRRLEAHNGDIIYRGQNGARDKVLRLEKIAKEFKKFLNLYMFWRTNGFKENIAEVRLVLLDLGHVILQAIAQRACGKSLFAPPKWAGPEYTLKLSNILKQLEEMH